MALTQLTQGLCVGTILWIKKPDESEGGDSHGLPLLCFAHPCVVLHISSSMKGFVFIYVITSRGGRNINDLPLRRQVRSRHVPIHPTPLNDLLPEVQLHLANGAELRKLSYVNTQTVYTYPLSKLELYDRHRPVTDFCLDSASIRWLREKAFFGEPLRDLLIQPTITPTTTSQPSTSSPLPSTSSSSSSYTIQVQPPLQFSSAPPHNPVHQYDTIRQPVILPSSRLQLAQPNRANRTYLPLSSSSSSSSNGRRPHNAIAPLPQTARILAVLATIVLLSVGLALWMVGGSAMLRARPR